MSPVILSGKFEVSGRITIAAAKKTGVIHADVTAHYTTAFLSLGMVFSGRRADRKQSLYQTIINTFTMRYSQGGQIELFSTAQQFNIIESGNTYQFRNQRRNLRQPNTP